VARGRCCRAFAEAMKLDPPSWEQRSERCSVCGEGELASSGCPACATAVLICVRCAAVFSIQQNKPAAQVGKMSGATRCHSCGGPAHHDFPISEADRRAAVGAILARFTAPSPHWLTHYYGKTLSSLGEIVSLNLQRTPAAGRSMSRTHTALWRLIRHSTIQDYRAGPSKCVAYNHRPSLFSIEYADGTRVLGSWWSAIIRLPDGRAGDIRLDETWPLCLKWSPPPRAKRLFDAPCAYCGREAGTGADDLLNFGKLKFMCIPCSIEHDRYVAEHLPLGQPSRSAEEQLVPLPSLRKFNDQLQLDEHMEQWLSKQDPIIGCPGPPSYIGVVNSTKRDITRVMVFNTQFGAVAAGAVSKFRRVPAAFADANAFIGWADGSQWQSRSFQGPWLELKAGRYTYKIADGIAPKSRTSSVPHTSIVCTRDE
jgi:hypothetical protein